MTLRVVAPFERPAGVVLAANHDVMRPGLRALLETGIDACRAILRHVHDARVVILGEDPDETYTRVLILIHRVETAAVLSGVLAGADELASGQRRGVRSGRDRVDATRSPEPVAPPRR